MNQFPPGYGAPPYIDPSFGGHYHPHQHNPHEIPPSVSPMDGVPGMPRMGNTKVTATFLTDMVVGQDQQGASINQNGLIPEAYTLQFSFVGVEKDVNGTPFIPTCRAIVTWKVDGQQQRRVVSIVSGASISGVCNGVDVKLVDVPLGGDSTEGKKYKVQATMSRGLRANTQEPPTLTEELIQSVASGANITFDVPQDAGVTQVYVLLATGSTADTPADTSVLVTMSDNHQPSNGLYGSFYPLKCCHWVPLAPGTQKIILFNGSGFEFFVQAIWGIDG
jgi:hypothetical protein